MIVLKLGGSVLTRKDERETVDDEALAAAADAVADAVGRGSERRSDGERRDDDATGASDGGGAGPDGADVDAAAPTPAPVPALDGGAGLVVVHGGGSFGHPYAEAAGISGSTGTHDAAAAVAVHAAMKRLNAATLDALHARGVPALPVHPLSAAARRAAGPAASASASATPDANAASTPDAGPAPSPAADPPLAYPASAVATMLAEGFVPLVHGDGVAHAGEGVSVLSGDEVVVRLARALDADRVGLCSTVPGVLDADGAVIDRVDAFADVADAVGASDATDVTGGMAGKVRTLLGLDAPAFVFGPAALDGFLAGDDVGTRIGTARD